MFLRNINVNINLIQQTLSAIRMYNKPVFSSSANSRHKNKNYEYKFKKLEPDDLLSLALENVKITKPQDWEDVKQFVLGHEQNRRFLSFNQHNMDGIIMAFMTRVNRLDLAQSYLKYLEESNVKPNLATIGRYLKLLYDNYQEKLSKAQELEILGICQDIQKNHLILDSRTLEAMLLALSLTKDWKECLNILQEIKRTSTVSSPAYSAVIAAAFLNKEAKLAWDLLHEVMSLDKLPMSITYLSYLKTLKRQRKKESIVKNLEELFMFFEETEILCPEVVVDDIIETFSLGQKTAVTFSGHCGNCKAKLENLELTDEEFSELKEVFFKNAIVGRDIFIKSNPDEMRRFQTFVDNMGKYDVVLDGLNVAYSAGTKKGPLIFSKTLATVISHFVEQKMSVLMLGRVHMTRWPKKHWNYIMQNTTVFLTQDISQDDPYLLYCALHSGKDTVIVTKDLMRGHKFLLKERKCKILFDRWLSQRQHFLLTINEQGRAFFKKPPHFTTVTQRSGNVWHVPYIPKNDELVNQSYHKTWLCLDCN